MSDETEKQLDRMRRVMGKLSREGRAREFEAVAEAYRVLKRERMEAVEVEQRAASLARRSVRAQEARERPRAWRLPPGFGVSPLARERARSGWRPRVEPTAPAGGLNPWRGRSPMEEKIWRP